MTDPTKPIRPPGPRRARLPRLDAATCSAARPAPCWRPLPAARRRLRRRLQLEQRRRHRRRGAPVKGGTLRAGFVGGGTAETLNPLIGVTPIDQGRIQNLYDPLVIVNPDLSTSPGPRARVDPQRRRHRVRGQAAPRRHLAQRQDVRRRRRHLLDPADGASRPALRGCRSSPAINLKDLKKVNNLTVKIPLTAPDADLAANFTYYNTWIDPERRDRLQEPDRHRPVHVRVVHARPAERVQAATRTTG